MNYINLPQNHQHKKQRRSSCAIDVPIPTILFNVRADSHEELNGHPSSSPCTDNGSSSVSISTILVLSDLVFCSSYTPFPLETTTDLSNHRNFDTVTRKMTLDTNDTSSTNHTATTQKRCTIQVQMNS